MVDPTLKRKLLESHMGVYFFNIKWIILLKKEGEDRLNTELEESGLGTIKFLKIEGLFYYQRIKKKDLKRDEGLVLKVNRKETN